MDIILEFELAKGASAENLAREVNDRLAAFDDVKEVETQVDEPRGVAEIAMVIAAGVVTSCSAVWRVWSVPPVWPGWSVCPGPAAARAEAVPG